MKISEISFNDLIPSNMKDDKTIRGFVAAFDHVIDLYRQKVGLVSLFENLNLLTDTQLDEMAAAIDIPWYDTGFETDAKKDILASHINAYFHAGTPRGIGETLGYIFGDVELSPWYEYGGEEFHYRLNAGATVSEAQVRTVVNTMRRIAPVNSVLDNIGTKLTGVAALYTACHARELIQYRRTRKAE